MAAGDLWACGYTPNAVYQRTGGVWQPAIAGPTEQSFIEDIAFDAAGDLWIAGDSPDAVYRRSGGVWQAGIDGPPGQTALRGMAFDAADDMWACGYSPNAVYRRTGGVWQAGIDGPPGQTRLRGMAFDAADDMWAVGGNPVAIYQRVNGVWQTGIAGPSGQSSVQGIAFDVDDDLWLVGTGPDAVYQRTGGVWQAGIAGPAAQFSLSGLRFEATEATPPGDAFFGIAGTAEWSASLGTATGITGTPGVAIFADAGTAEWSAAFGTARGRARRAAALDSPQVLIAAGAQEIASESYTVMAARPKLARRIGMLYGGRDVVARYADPVWTIEFRLGPLPRADTLLLRQWVGLDNLTVEFRDDQRPPSEWPHEEIWINSVITATLIDAVPQAVNADITRGDLWRCTIEFRESQVA